jgi:hypothetical protein
MNRKTFMLMGYIALACALLFPVSASAQVSAEQRQGRLQVGADIGPVFGTPDSTAFGLALHGDYFFHQNFSVGPLLQFGFTSDLFQVGPTVQLKYTFDIDRYWKANLQGGLGFMYAELERRGSDPDDTSFLLPVGAGLEYRLNDSVSIGSTLLFNFTDLDKVRNENFHIALLGGLRFRF